MPNDDLKIGVTADLNLAEQNGQSWADAFMRGATRGLAPLMSGQLLGSGMAPTQGTGQNVTSILSQILVTLQYGFQGVVAAQGGAGSAPPGARPTTGAQQPQSAGSPAGSQGSQGVNWGGIAGAVGRVPVEGIVNAAMTNFSRTGSLALAAELFSGVPLVGGGLRAATQLSGLGDDYIFQAHDMFRGGGEKSRRNFRTTIEQDSGQKEMKRLGLTRDDVHQIFKQGAQAGMTEGTLDLPSMGNMRGAMQLQGRYGLGGQGIGLMHAITQGGGSGQEQNLFAQTLAVAIGTNLDRGRWGEAFSAMTKAAQRVQTGVVDRNEMLTNQMFVGGMGAQFKGDSAQGARASGMLQDMQGGGGGPLGNIMALRAAGLGSGGNYIDSWMQMQRGSAKGGVPLAALMQQFKRLPMVRRYLASVTPENPEGDQQLRNRAVFLLSIMMPGYKPIDIEGMLKSLAKGDPAGPSDDVVGAMKRQMESGGFPKTEQDRVSDMKVNKSLVGPNVFEGASKDTKGVVESMDDLNNMPPDYSTTRGDIPYGSDKSVYEKYGETTPGPSGIHMPNSRTSENFMRKHVPPGGLFESRQRPDHKAVDIPMAEGTTIHAVEEGEVTAVGFEKTMGNYVIVTNRKSGAVTRYLHLSKILVSRGTQVKRGQPIGKSGNTGLSTGPHLHVDRQRRDPKTGLMKFVDPAIETDLEDTISPKPDRATGGKAGDKMPGQYNEGEVLQVPVTKPSDVDTGPTSMRSSRDGVIDVNINVYDTRVSVVKKANRRQVGPSNTLGSGKKISS